MMVIPTAIIIIIINDELQNNIFYDFHVYDGFGYDYFHFGYTSILPIKYRMKFCDCSAMEMLNPFIHELLLLIANKLSKIVLKRFNRWGWKETSNTRPLNEMTNKFCKPQSTMHKNHKSTHKIKSKSLDTNQWTFISDIIIFYLLSYCVYFSNAFELIP